MTELSAKSFSPQNNFHSHSLSPLSLSFSPHFFYLFPSLLTFSFSTLAPYLSLTSFPLSPSFSLSLPIYPPLSLSLLTLYVTHSLSLSYICSLFYATTTDVKIQCGAQKTLQAKSQSLEKLLEKITMQIGST
jgi:hypothetical protein